MSFPGLDQGIQKVYSSFVILDSRFRGNDILWDSVMTKKNKNLIWVYPPNNWVSNFNKTFVYGSSNPRAKLFVSVEVDQRVCPDIKWGKHIGLPIQIFPNGNFAQVIKLPKKKNVVSLIQILNGKKRILTRTVISMSLRKKRRCMQRLNSNNHQSCLPQVDRYLQNDIVIVIDPGHGGKEYGTHSSKGIPEKVFNLQIAKLLYRKLTIENGQLRIKKHKIKIYLTRTKDKFVSLKDRVDFAKKKKADILISIHHNALPDNEDPLRHRGVGVYFTHGFVKPFAKKLLDSITKETKLKKYGIFKRDFAVTRPDFYHGILVECGFLIHPIEGEYITQRKIQKKIVSGAIKEILDLLK